jgi:hypothetical protein
MLKLPRRLYSLATDHGFVKDSLIASASSLHFELTHCLHSRQMSAEFLHTALRGLQTAIEALSPTNTDAVLIASFCLPWGAQDWYVVRFLELDATNLLHLADGQNYW